MKKLLPLLLALASLASADERFDLRSESLADDAAKNMDGLVSWRVEGLGTREELLRPGSLFGTVGLSRPFGAGFDVRQNPHVLGGLAPQVRPEDRPAFLDLYGNNGQLVGELLELRHGRKTVLAVFVRSNFHLHSFKWRRLYH